MMSESSSIVTDSASSRATGNTTSSGHSNISGTNVPLVLISAYKDEQARNNNKDALPKLPSHKYRYTNWYDLQLAKIKGDQLKAPRVRAGPRIKEKTFYSVRNNEGKLIHHDRKGKERKNFRNLMENWENAEFCNLSYQDLYDSYQKENFMRILKRLMRVVDLNLIDDGLLDLHSVHLPNCTHLNLNGNHLDHFNKLPKIPKIQELTVVQNNIDTLSGIEALRKTPIHTLNLQGNPAAFTENYRQRVFQALPQLKILDNVHKLKSDEIIEEEFEEANKSKSGMCIIS